LLVATVANPLVFVLGIVGRSARTRVRGERTPDAPEGVARTILAVWEGAEEMVNEPAVVIGVPATANQDGTARPTLVTVPDPPAVGAMLIVVVSVPLSLGVSVAPVAVKFSFGLWVTGVPPTWIVWL
jgi:hypothetical protein